MSFEQYIIRTHSEYYLHLSEIDANNCNITLEQLLSNLYIEFKTYESLARVM